MLAIGDNKRCSHCKTWQPLSCYGIARRAKDGLKDECKQCRYEYEHRPEVREKILARKKRNNDAVRDARLKATQRIDQVEPVQIETISTRPPPPPKKPIATKPLKYDLTTWESRAKLEMRHYIYWHHLSDKLSLGWLKRHDRLAGTWIVRIHLGTDITGKASPYSKRHIGPADDYEDEDNSCLNFDQARRKAFILERKINPRLKDKIEEAPRQEEEIYEVEEIEEVDDASPIQEAALRRHERNRVNEQMLAIFGMGMLRAMKP